MQPNLLINFIIRYYRIHTYFPISKTTRDDEITKVNTWSCHHTWHECTRMRPAASAMQVLYLGQQPATHASMASSPPLACSGCPVPPCPIRYIPISCCLLLHLSISSILCIHPPIHAIQTGHASLARSAPAGLTVAIADETAPHQSSSSID
jgi:hypothetical protein